MKSKNYFKIGESVLLVSEKRTKTIFLLKEDAIFHSTCGYVKHNDLIGLEQGSFIKTHSNKIFLALKPTVKDFILYGMERKGQIIYPSDIGYILQYLNVYDSDLIIEAGSGSGSMTLSLAHALKEDSKLCSYDVRKDMTECTKRNISRFGLSHKVNFYNRDVFAEGFIENDVDACFIDLPKAYDIVHNCFLALKNGGAFCALTVTTNDSMKLLDKLNQYNFCNIEMCEIFLRYYKTVSQRLRPNDNMISHTGYIFTARKVSSSNNIDWRPVDNKGRSIIF